MSDIPAPIIIEVEFSDDSLFGYTDPVEAGIDVETSVSQFTELLVARLTHDYPETDIIVKRGDNDTVHVDRDDWHPESPWIDQAIEQVWNGDGWIEYWEGNDG